jgi:hypothetical protein
MVTFIVNWKKNILANERNRGRDGSSGLNPFGTGAFDDAVRDVLEGSGLTWKW